MSDKNHELIFKRVLDAVSVNAIGNGGINCTEWVIEQVNVSVRIDGSCQADARFLSS